MRDSAAWTLTFSPKTAACNSKRGIVKVCPFVLSFGLILVFEQTILPALTENCFGCHSKAENVTEGGLELDSAAGLRQGGDNGGADSGDGLAGDAFKFVIESGEQPQ